MINVNNMRTDNRRDIQFNDVISEEVKNKINEAKIDKKSQSFPVRQCYYLVESTKSIKKTITIDNLLVLILQQVGNYNKIRR